MKIKLNPAKDSFSIESMTVTEFSVINALMSHVRLGTGNVASKVAFNFNHMVEEMGVEGMLHEVEITAEPSDALEHITVQLDAPTLNLYV